MFSKWLLQQKRLINVDDQFWQDMYARFVNNDPGLHDVLTQDFLQYLNLYATSNGTTVGMVFPCLLSVVNYVMAAKGCCVTMSSKHRQNFNTSILVGGDPFTGKSPAVDCTVRNPINNIAALKESMFV